MASGRYRLTDMVRATIAYEHIDAMYAGLRALVGEFGQQVKEFNDRYQVRRAARSFSRLPRALSSTSTTATSLAITLY